MPKLTHIKERRIFPSPLDSLEGGIVAVGLEPTVSHLLEAYSFGIFPWPHEGMPLLWFSPDERGVLDFNEFHIYNTEDKTCVKSGFFADIENDGQPTEDNVAAIFEAIK